MRIQEENQSKNGGLDFKNQFGRMSMKEYEMLRQKYSQHNNDMNRQNNYYYKDINTNENTNKDLNSDYNAINYNNYENKNVNNNENNNDKSQNYEKHDVTNKKISYSSKNVVYLDSHMKNAGLKFFDWDSDERMSDNRNSYNIKENYNDNNNKRVLNENLFKRKKTNDNKKKYSIYARDNINSNKNNRFEVNDVNNFNNQIMQNKNWGKFNSSHNIGRINFSNSIKKGEGINMRTRKK